MRADDNEPAPHPVMQPILRKMGLYTVPRKVRRDGNGKSWPTKPKTPPAGGEGRGRGATQPTVAKEKAKRRAKAKAARRQKR